MVPPKWPLLHRDLRSCPQRAAASGARRRGLSGPTGTREVAEAWFDGRWARMWWGAAVRLRAFRAGRTGRCLTAQPVRGGTAVAVVGRGLVDLEGSDQVF